MKKVFKILVIDDEEDLRENLKYIFSTKGYEVSLAEDGVQGLKKLETYTPDLIILDLNMPHMGGIEFYQKICDNAVPRYPVFVLTARANMEKLFKDFNVDGFMAKPFEIPELINEISTVLEKRSGNASTLPSGGLKTVCIVENDEAFANKVGAALLMKGFTVNLASSGVEAIERISRDVPRAACVKMNLPDMPGELVIMKLKNMAKTSAVKFILYVLNVGIQDEITKKIQQKEGFHKFVVVDSENELVNAIKEL